MPPNPLTPPHDDPVDTSDHVESVNPPTDQTPLLATPESYADMDFDAWDSRSDSLEEGQADAEMVDEEMSDDDTVDGGAALHTTTSDLEDELNDAMEMAAENLLELFNSSAFPPSFMGNSSVYSDASPPSHESEVTSEATDELPQTSILPTINSVTQQLEHLQDAPGHPNVFPVQAELYYLPNFSIPPLSFLSEINSASHPIPAEEGEIVSMSDVTTVSSLAGSNSSQDPPPLGNVEGLMLTPTFHTVNPPQSPNHESPSTQDDPFWGDWADSDEVDDRSNFGLGDFLQHWGSQPSSYTREIIQKRKAFRSPEKSNQLNKSFKAPSLTELHAQWPPKELPPIKRRDLQGEQCDIQRLDWEKLGVTRDNARLMRQLTYKNYTNMKPPPQWHPYLEGSQLRDSQNFFRFRQMSFDQNVFMSHFQLRNMISCASRNHVFYAGKSKIYQWDPTGGNQAPKKVAMNLANSTMHLDPVQISTLTVDHNILFVGGFCGEYSMVNLRAHKDTKYTEGIVTYHDNAITNHVQVHLSRTSHSPQVAIASNDSHLRVLDVATNKIVADHGYDHAINCSAISPDQRLRVLVGDSQEVMICHSETGEVLHRLEGHQDYGFACDWADDGWTVATGNQDMLVKIWDARKWTTSSGAACPVTTIASEMAGVRKLKFSPLGSGKKILVAAEAADTVNIIDAETFKRKQELTFFGEIGGFDFTNGGRDLFVAVCDNMRSGIVEFERADFASASMYQIEDLLEGQPFTKRRLRTGYDWRATDEEVTHAKGSWGTLEGRRKGVLASMGKSLDHF